MKPNCVLNHFSNKAAIAEALNISPQAVQQWFDKGAIPIGRQFQLQVVTNGLLKVDPMPEAASCAREH